MFVFVASVGLIVVALSPAPLTVTPAGTVNGQVSAKLPAETLIISPLEATLKAFATVKYASLIVLPELVSLPFSAT